jgi:hypothetical protein
MTTLRRITTHTLMAITEGAIIAALVVGLIAGTAVAGKSNGGTTTDLRLVMVYDANGDHDPNYRDRISFTFNTSVAKPYVGVRCYQGSDFVFDDYVGYFSGNWLDDGTFTLASNYWDAASSADCTARLFSYDRRGRERVQATMGFSVAP